jgi:hypothetical protein
MSREKKKTRHVCILHSIMGKYNAIKSLMYKIPCHPKKEEKTNKTIPKKNILPT